MYFKGIVTELLWFLRGDTNIKYLVDNDCHIWDGDAYQSYCKRYWQLDERDKIEYGSSYYNHETDEYEFETYSKEEFVEKIKTDDGFANQWGELGPVYGKQWRDWEHNTGDTWVGMSHKSSVKTKIDQIQNLINDLKTNPDSRRLMVSAWNVGELDKMTLPPCHYGFQVYTRELSWYDDLNKIKEIYVNWSLSKPSGGYAGDIKADVIESANQIFVDGWQNNKDPFTGKPLIELECFSSIPKRAISLMWNQRSVDTFLGLPFNIASYGLLLEIIAKEVNMVPDELIGNLGDTHLYLNHIEQAKEQIGRELSLTERRAMVTQEMFNQIYNGGGPETLSHSEIDQWDVPRVKTRQPYPLPKLVINDEFWNPDASLIDQIEHIEISDFEVRDYQSHPTIKAPLSN
jgi:thymidylate synthase